MKRYNMTYRYKRKSTEGNWTSGSRTVSANNETNAQIKLKKELGNPEILDLQNLREC